MGMGLSGDASRNDPRAIRRVVVMGGTHGNERTGVHAVQYIRNHPDEFRHGSVEQVEGILANPRAIQRNVRYLDRDLNRCFFYDYSTPLAEAQLEGRVAGMREFEMGRALTIRRDLQALAEPVPFLIDLHTTTSNMGTCLMVSDEDPWTLQFCARLAKRVPCARIVSDGPVSGFQGTAASLARNHLTLELGPVAQGVVDLQALGQVLAAVKAAIEIVDELNGDAAAASSIEGLGVSVYRWLDFSLDYPRELDGIPAVSVHPKFLGADFETLSPETPVFLGFQGKEILLAEAPGVASGLLERLRSGHGVYPMFIGEAAYVEKGLAFLTTEQVKLG